ncbi:MAG: hypothetical protein B7Z66_06465 [Chromatiales bacterium 21-64-14]|nr:MAG: hypothetical protein B7Z66_06465 [Chromatiales bacterium 21-64-14]HQU16940.1 cytochrome c oxidase assembly protein [Gammaproteobacteria bacterium]
MIHLLRRIAARAGQAVLVLLTVGIAPAYAHGWIFPGEPVWALWEVTPEVTLPTLLVVGLYWAGTRKRRQRGHPTGRWRQTAFYTGVAAIYLALQGPLDPMADRLFVAHQIEHLLLRMLGPMLLSLSAPIAELLMGFPMWARRTIVRPVVRNRVVRAIYAFFLHPAVATTMFVGALYFWQIPHYHDLAILDDPFHDLMHFTMLWSGLFFFWLMLDPRSRSAVRVPYRLRYTLLVFSMLATIVLGATITFKGIEWYPAYDLWGRLWGVNPMVDETWGGLLIWIPSAMMSVITGLVMLRMLLRFDQQGMAQRTARTSARVADGDGGPAPAQHGALP